MSSTGDDETLTSRCPGVSTRPGHTSHSRPRPSSPEVDNGINIAGRESLRQFIISIVVLQDCQNEIKTEAEDIDIKDEKDVTLVLIPPVENMKEVKDSVL